MVHTGLRVSNLLKTESDRQQLASRIEAPAGEVGNGVDDLDRHVMRTEDVLLKVEGKEGLISALAYSHLLEDVGVVVIMCSVVTSKSNQKAAG
jgi:hypothetical protein